MQTHTEDTTLPAPTILRPSDLRANLARLKYGFSLSHEGLSFYESRSSSEQDFLEDNPWMTVRYTVSLDDGRTFNGY